MTTHFAILPEGLLQTLALQLSSDGQQFLSLPHPRTGCFSLYVSNDTEILEVQAVAPTNPRSWFLDQEVVEDGKMLVITPIDPALLLIPLLESANASGTQMHGTKVNSMPTQSTVFRTADDIFEQLSQKTNGADNVVLDAESSQAKSISGLANLKCTPIGLRRICEVKEFSSDTVVYRYSQERAIQYLKRKVDRLVQSKDLDQSKTITRILARDGLMEDGKENILEQGRIRATCELVAQYLTPSMKTALLATYDFKALDNHLATLRQEEVPLKSTTNTGKGKSAGTKVADEGKKRKAAKGSHGVEQLKKVNTTGMAKLSSFFTKTAK